MGTCTKNCNLLLALATIKEEFWGEKKLLQLQLPLDPTEPPEAGKMKNEKNVLNTTAAPFLAFHAFDAIEREAQYLQSDNEKVKLISTANNRRNLGSGTGTPQPSIICD